MCSCAGNARFSAEPCIGCSDKGVELSLKLFWGSCHILIPHDLARLTLLPVQKPTNCPRYPIVPPIVCTSSSLRSTNCSVSRKSVEVSVVMKSSELAYTAARDARLVYQDVSTLVSPARYQISSERALSSFREACMFSNKDM
jgi:hypothetical protein